MTERNPLVLLLAEMAGERVYEQRAQALERIAAAIGELEERRLAEETERFNRALAQLLADVAYRRITAAEGLPRTRGGAGRS